MDSSWCSKLNPLQKKRLQREGIICPQQRMRIELDTSVLYLDDVTKIIKTPNWYKDRVVPLRTPKILPLSIGHCHIRIPSSFRTYNYRILSMQRTRWIKPW